MSEEPKFKGLWTCPDYKIRLNDAPPFEFKCTGMQLTDEGAEAFEEELTRQYLTRVAAQNVRAVPRRLQRNARGVAEPREVARWADYPVNEADLHARHLWLVRQRQFIERMKTDPECYDAKIAGWWVWGICCWIGSGWCVRTEWNGRINAARAERGVHRTALEDANWRKRLEMKRGGRGVHSEVEERTAQKRPRISGWSGTGVHRSLELREGDERRPHLGRLPDLGGEGGAAGRGIHASGKRLEAIEQYADHAPDKGQGDKVTRRKRASVSPCHLVTLSPYPRVPQ